MVEQENTLWEREREEKRKERRKKEPVAKKENFK